MILLYTASSKSIEGVFLLMAGLAWFLKSKNDRMAPNCFLIFLSSRPDRVSSMQSNYYGSIESSRPKAQQRLVLAPQPLELRQNGNLCVDTVLVSLAFALGSFTNFLHRQTQIVRIRIFNKLLVFWLRNPFCCQFYLLPSKQICPF